MTIHTLLKCPQCGGTLFTRIMTETVEIEVHADTIIDNLVGEKEEPTFQCEDCGKEFDALDIQEISAQYPSEKNQVKGVVK